MLKIITDKALREAAERIKKKADVYHHVCYGGGTTSMIDHWSHCQTEQCRYKGRDVWDVKWCQKCDGTHTCKEPELRDSEEHFNNGVEALARDLLLQGGS